ncbi:DUF2357 domain-containing protein [Draconibacterium sp. IB214405]|uniref:DUF2357 domain-containing protein n=1 Tax=Draconibacterium sp. IB214405 TaxID=3097352 RepID=UPI002A115E47|nr:DUF2357 domain-containing protein [Draconibacterium sp. IB214405]MDX8337870.1 DUF2357 domain-containing protein [Draconibacterium sp. IB214405]
MQVLALHTEFYELTVFSGNLKKSWEMFYSRCSENAFEYTRYSLDSDSANNELRILNLANEAMVGQALEEETSPVFFENANYLFDVYFKEEPESKPTILHKRKEITQAFHYRDKVKLLSGTIQFGNNPGTFDFVISFKHKGKLFKDTFTFDVVSRKLDFKSDYNILLRDINNEYNNLVFDFLKKTYSTFQQQGHVNNQLIWISIFERIIKEYLKALKYVLNKPHNNLVTETRFTKAEKIKRWSPQLEEEVAENRQNQRKYFGYNEQKLTLDTLENRFVKYTITQIYRTYRSILTKIQDQFEKQMDKEYLKNLETYESELKKLKHNSFFRNIGKFEGMKQESHVLQKRTGYAQVYKSWILFKKGIDILEGVNKIGLKDISELYEIWCFLQMKKLISSIEGVELLTAELSEVHFQNFVFQLREGKKSRITFINTHTNEEIELFHEVSYSSSTKQAGSYTIPQQPDIVLKVRKDDIQDAFECTYLYDAKYRVNDIEENKVDFPTDDSINQMHRYRDAIYYRDLKKSVKSKEVIGGYVLFPGRGKKEDFESEYFVKSINEVNIGAFPLLPSSKDYDNKDLLKEHLKSILNADSANILGETIPQKGLRYEEPDGTVLVGFTASEKQKDMFVKENTAIYHMPVGSANLDRLNKIKYFAPYIHNVSSYFEVDEISIVPRKFIEFGEYIPRKESLDLYYVLKLSQKRYLKNEVKFSHGNPVIRYGSLSKLRKAETLKDLI